MATLTVAIALAQCIIKDIKAFDLDDIGMGAVVVHHDTFDKEAAPDGFSVQVATDAGDEYVQTYDEWDHLTKLWAEE